MSRFNSINKLMIHAYIFIKELFKITKDKKLTQKARRAIHVPRCMIRSSVQSEVLFR